MNKVNKTSDPSKNEDDSATSGVLKKICKNENGLVNGGPKIKTSNKKINSYKTSNNEATVLHKIVLNGENSDISIPKDSNDNNVNTILREETVYCENGAKSEEDCLDKDMGKLLLDAAPEVNYIQYQSELQMPNIMKIIQKDLSEPYSIYTYRYFIHNWPKLCFLAMHNEICVGAIVCKLDVHRKVIRRGYIAMLAVDKNYRKLGIGSTLVKKAIEEMISGDADEVVLETEVTNKPALQLYEALGFVRDKRLFRYYLNGVDALRLKLWLR